MKMHTLHFTFGPVQEFVSQARKTRDLWTGSYLLSYLAGHAMLAVISHGGEITLPDIDGDGIIELIQNPENGNPDNPATRIGSLPNRFTASVPEEISGVEPAKAISEVWKKITEEVRTLLNKKKQVIDDETWNRQVDNLWEFQWVIGENDALLNQRKNMRCHIHAPEPGEKCTMCGERKEISRVAQSKLSISKINEWWKENIRGETVSDLNDGERLCSVCLTKRLFPVVAKKSLGWGVSKYFPSTSFMAAIDWLYYLLQKAKDNDGLKDAIQTYVQVVQKNITNISTEYHTMIPSLQNAAEAADVPRDILSFDGNLFHPFAIAGDTLQFTEQSSPDKIGKALNSIKDKLKKQNEDSVHKSQATPFYAILLMDGDGMGKLLSGRSREERKTISSALAKFTGAIPDIVKEHNGWLIYAGGDDVFALLPVDKALDCAVRCREAYRNAFKVAPFVAQEQATISAAIQFAHMKTPLGPLVRDAHRLLDEIAKDATGRDSIACRVWKRGGPILTWAQPWEKVLLYQDKTVINEVRRAFQHGSEDSHQFSSKFFYKLKDLFDFVNEGEIFSKTEDIRDLLVVEYLGNREHVWNRELSQEQIVEKASERVDLLLKLCQKYQRRVESDSEGKPVAVIETARKGYVHDGALLVRFLSQKEV